jgi:hypothetical protein
LRIVVIAFTTLVSASLIEGNGRLQVAVAIEVDPLNTLAAGELFLCFEEPIRDTISTRGWLYIKPLTFAG